MSVNLITRRQLYELLKQIAEKHYQINSFGWGDVPEILGETDIIYPLMMVTPQPISMREGEVAHVYLISICDRLQKGNDNKKDVDSDMYQVWRDVVAQLEFVDQIDFGVEFPLNPEPVQGIDAQGVYGFSGNISIIVDENYDSCAVPSDPVIFDPTITCAPATYRVQYVNGTLIEEGEIPSGASKTINVPNPIVCEDAEYEVLDSDGNVLYSGSIASGGNEQITILNSTININKSDGSLITSLSVLAQSTTNYNVADSTITNDPTSPTYTQAVKATEKLVLPPQNILVNTVNEGVINSVGDIEINTNVTPDSVSVVGRVVSINVPTGETPSGVLFDFPTPQQRVSYRTGDVGWRVQNGWYDYTPPATPAAVAELDYSSANFWYLLKNNLVVDGQSSKTRFVDVDGVQTFSATGNKDLILVDKFTGLGIYRGNLASTYSWETAIVAANTLSIVVDGVTYDEWYLISVAEWVKLVYGRGNNGAMVDAVTSVNILNMAAATYILSDSWSSNTLFKRTWRDDAGNNILGTAFANQMGFRALFITKQTMSLITAP